MAAAHAASMSAPAGKRRPARPAAQWSWVAAVALLVVLVVLPATFNVPGDKHHDGYAVSGPVRIGIELLLVGAAVLGAGVAWAAWAAAAASLLAAADLVVGLSRWVWLLRSMAAIR